eukprot:1514698-Rhodomonas_salina.2
MTHNAFWCAPLSSSARCLHPTRMPVSGTDMIVNCVLPGPDVRECARNTAGAAVPMHRRPRAAGVGASRRSRRDDRALQHRRGGPCMVPMECAP